MSAVVLQGDARDLPLPDASVDLIVTSPPYFGLRSYTDGGEHYAGQIGSEATPQEWVANLLACTREWIRVLKPSGSLFVNLGDKYAGGGQWDKDERPDPGRRRAVSGKIGTGGNCYGLKPKSLLGLPWRYALACIDQLGLILRAEIVWSKPNGLPESVTDRVRRSHEQVFHFTRLPRYYSAVDEIREATTAYRGAQPVALRDRTTTLKVPGNTPMSGTQLEPNPLGKLPGSVWDIPSQPLTVPPALGVDHFAAFPMELPRRIILGWSPPGVCTACGEGRRPVADKQFRKKQESYWDRKAKRDSDEPDGNDRGFNSVGYPCGRYEVTISAYSCGCGIWPLDAVQPSTRPAVVLDPFGGTGTTALVATMHGRTGISVDRSADYSRLAAWRTNDSGQRAAALQVPKPPAVME